MRTCSRLASAQQLSRRTWSSTSTSCTTYRCRSMESRSRCLSFLTSSPTLRSSKWRPSFPGVWATRRTGAPVPWSATPQLQRFPALLRSSSLRWSRSAHRESTYSPLRSASHHSPRSRPCASAPRASSLATRVSRLFAALNAHAACSAPATDTPLTRTCALDAQKKARLSRAPTLRSVTLLA